MLFHFGKKGNKRLEQYIKVKPNYNFCIRSITLPSCQETQGLEFRIYHSKELIERSEEFLRDHGTIPRPREYTFLATKPGNYEIHMYYAKDSRKWVPREESDFFGRHERYVRVIVE